jgi:hypothetical protein
LAQTIFAVTTNPKSNCHVIPNLGKGIFKGKFKAGVSATPFCHTSPMQTPHKECNCLLELPLSDTKSY